MKQKPDLFLLLGCHLLAFSVGAQVTPKSKVPQSPTIGSRGAGSYQQAFLPDGTLIRKNANGRESLVVSAVPMSIQAVRTINSANRSLVPKVIHLTDSNAGGDFVLDTTDKTTPDNIGRILVTKSGLRYKRFITDGQINVRWYSNNTNTGEGTQNDAPALQAAINDARTYNAKNKGTVRLDVVLGNGYFALDKPIDATNAPGLTIRGGNGGYFNCTIVGNTGGIIIDLTGSSEAHVEGITFLSYKNSSHPSPIGVLFALSQNDKGERLGGLNCSLSNCFFRLESNPSFNGGMGTIGVMNIRSEEFHMSRCFIQANTPVVFSNRNNLSLDTPYPLTITSPYAKIANDMTGSMGVIDMTGENSLQAFQRLSPALLLNGVNSVLFHGYIGRIGDLSIGKEESAVVVCQPTLNIQLSGTIEGYSTAMRLQNNCILFNSTINFALANQNDPTQPVMWMYPESQIQGSKVSYSFGNPNEMKNRPLIYAQPMNSGNAPTTCSIINSEIISTQFPDNALAVSANLLKNCQNVTFGTQQPFEKKGVWVRSLTDTPKSLGIYKKTSQTVTGQIIRFNQVTKADVTEAKGGFYNVHIRGVVEIGGGKSGVSGLVSFESTVLIQQTDANKIKTQDTSTLISANTSTNPSLLKIVKIQPSVSLSQEKDGYGIVSLAVTCSGTSDDEPVIFVGQVELLSKFPITQSTLFD